MGNDGAVVDTVSPRVSEVLISGTAWSDAFLTAPASNGLGSGGYRIPVGATAPVAPLP